MTRLLTTPATTLDILQISPVIPVVVLHDAEQGVPLAEALLAGGIHIIEVTLRTDAGLDAIARVARDVPDMTIGAGTVTSRHQAVAAQEAGAEFIVIPGSPSLLVDAVLATGLPLLAGASTLTEVMTLAHRGQRAVKFFPAEASGGVDYLRALHGPLPDAVFCPTGGVNPVNAPNYLSLANVACVGGSWLSTADLLARQDWAAVEDLAREASRLES